MLEYQAKLHADCPMCIRWKQFKGQSTPTPGLFCAKHDVWLEWMDYDTANELIDMGVPEERYLDRKKKKPTKIGA